MDINGLYLSWSKSSAYAIREAIKEEQSQHTKALTDAIRNTNSDNPVWSFPRAENARFNASTRQGVSGCLEQTRVDVLRDIDRWVMDDNKGAPWMFVLQGLAGTGKSTLAHTVCETIAKRGWLGASFFFSRNEASCSNPFLVFTTIAYQLATLYPQFHNALTAILKRDPDVVGLTLEMQLEKLVVEPIRAAADDIGSDPVVVVIDAVDECGNYRAQILSLLCNARPEIRTCEAVCEPQGLNVKLAKHS
ncbi:hypothetical protein PILCRDRAFT_293369 [Piloderma croceum F 1598]|uniref:Nephrocystin 3-like N-terminal domain-containing protein n=1 Tax=Piloderma croceum (strain F 1598) TaxID=765440 RepID=A0A0C3CB80_PILCF|nr:hypothetical protein PILCRDRAFT_293369 [Piloderma croceum F 1598]